MITHNSTGGVVSAAVRLAFADITETNILVNQVFVSNFQKVRFVFSSVLIGHTHREKKLKYDCRNFACQQNQSCS